MSASSQKKKNHSWRKRPAQTAPDYQRLLRPLPEPPAGLSWVKTTDGDWILVDTTAGNATAVAVAAGFDDQYDHCFSATTAAPPTIDAPCCVVVLDDEADHSMPQEASSLQAPPPPVAQATIVLDENTSVSTSQEGEEETADVVATETSFAALPKSAPLPQATMVTPSSVVGTTTSVITSSVAMDDDDDDNNLDEKWKGCLHVDYTEHVILPTDTLAGLCLMYKISKRELQRANGFFSDNLRLAPETLIIPITDKARRLGWKRQDCDSKPFKMHSVLARCPQLSMMEAKCYLVTNDWNLQDALQEALADEEWERQELEKHRLHQHQQRQQKEKQQHKEPKKRDSKPQARPETELSLLPTAIDQQSVELSTGLLYLDQPATQEDEDDDDDDCCAKSCGRFLDWLLRK